MGLKARPKPAEMWLARGPTNGYSEGVYVLGRTKPTSEYGCWVGNAGDAIFVCTKHFEALFPQHKLEPGAPPRKVKVGIR